MLMIWDMSTCLHQITPAHKVQRSLKGAGKSLYCRDVFPQGWVKWSPSFLSIAVIKIVLW